MQPNPSPPDIRPLTRLLRRTRRLLRSSWVVTGLCVTVGLGLGALVTMSLLDVVIPLWPAFRLAALLLIIVPTALAFLGGVVLPLLRPLAPGQVARRIEAKIPGIHNRLVSCLDLTAQNNGKPFSAFFRRLVGEAIERVRGFRARMVVNFQRLRRSGIFAGLTALAFLLAWIIFSDRLPTAMARIFAPMADIPPASSVAYSVLPKDAKVLRGEDITFTVNVDKGEPENLRLELYAPGAAKPLWYNLQKQQDRKWKLTLNPTGLAGFEQAFHYRVHGGGTWSKQYQVIMVERPTITALHTRLHYPPYMRISEPRVGPPQIAEVTGPEDSQVEVVVDTEGQVAKGEIQFLASRLRRVPAKERLERVWFEDRLPAGAVTQDPWKWDLATHKRATHVGTFWDSFKGDAKGFPVNKAEHVFAHVYIVPNGQTEALMLTWDDGASREHRAYWGKDTKLIQAQGKRKYMGSLPAQGQWVRLEAPADWVGLDGKTLHGMGFIISGGQCYWSRTGSLPPPHVDEQEWVPTASFPMRSVQDNHWSGRFPLRGSGLYRVELKNELGHANKTMKEAKYLAIPDMPPQIVLERPGADLVLSHPGKVPLVVTAYDDFGLDAIELLIRSESAPATPTRSASDGVTKRVLKSYSQPPHSDTIITSLDLAALKMKVGDSIRYRLAARDTKGQITQTAEFLVRIASDKNSADELLTNFEKSQDPFQEKLVKLIAEQAKVRAAMEKLSGTYAVLGEKIDAAQIKTGSIKEVTPNSIKEVTPNPAKPGEVASLKLDAESAKMLQALQGELKGLAKQEEQNVQLGKQVSDDLAKSAAEASKLQLLPQEVTQQMQGLQDFFRQKGLGAMQNLAARMQQGADPKGLPDLKNLKQLSDRLQRDLEAMQARLQALAKARKQVPDDADAALKQLQKQLLQQANEMKAQELQDLQDFLAKLRQEMRRLQIDQDQLLKGTKKAPDDLLKEMEAKQKDLDKDADTSFAKLKKLLNADKAKRMKRKPSFPDQPYTPESEEKLVRPNEEDPDEPAAGKKDNPKGTNVASNNKKEKKDVTPEEEEPKFLPALGGPKPKLDPRFAKKVRPLKRKPKANSSPQDRRDDLESHQAEQMQDLNAAEQSLASDQNALEQLLQQMQQAMAGKEGQPMSASALAQALAMASRMQQAMQAKGQQGQQQANAPPQQPSQGLTPGNLQGGKGPGSLNAELAKMDPEMRTVVLRLPPQVREQLLQGLREGGPEGYRQLIQNYFHRLAEVNRK